MSAQDGVPNGGPAFPFVWHNTAYCGMTLRDWCAGQALAGIFSAPESVLWPKTPENVARLAYDLADAMLAARAKP